MYSKNDSSVLKALEFKNLQTDSGTACGISFDFELDNSNSNNTKAQIAVKEDANDGYAAITFSTTPNSNSSTLEERMRIASDNKVLINTPSQITGEGVLQVKGNSSQNVSAIQTATNGNYAIRFFNASTSAVGYIAINSSSTTYSTSSDYRLKENAVAISDGITRLKTLKPYRFNFIADNDEDGNPTQTVDGFFAHEVTAVPEAINGEKDATETYTDDNGDEQTRINPQGIDQSKLVPLLTAALKEAITKIETLETEMTALKARVTTLEG